MLLLVALDPLCFSLSHEKYLKNLRVYSLENRWLASLGSAHTSQLWQFSGTFWVKAQKCPHLTARAMTMSPPPSTLLNKKVVYFLYPRLHAKLQEYENKQDNSYVERPYTVVGLRFLPVWYNKRKLGLTGHICPLSKESTAASKRPLYPITSSTPQLFSYSGNPQRKSRANIKHKQWEEHLL